MDRKDIIDYLTTFELMSDRERAFFRCISSNVSSTAKSIVDASVNAYQKTPATVKAGILTSALASALTAGFIFGYQAATKTEPKVKKTCVHYRVEHAPLRSREYGFECVTPDKLAKMHRDPYTTIIKRE